MNYNMATISEEEPLTFEQAAECRAKAEQVLSHLQGDASSPSWVRGAAAAHRHHHDHPNNNTISTSQQAQYFDTHGFLVNKNFANSEMVKSLKEQMATLVDEHWDPFAQDGKEEIDTFGTDAAANTARGDYFLDSSNRVHYFAEQKALDQKNFNNKQLQLKEEFVVAKEDKLSILNKAGHGMHNNPGAFRDYTLSDKMRNLVLDLGWKDPVVPQSMYIFKQAKIGGRLVP
jgi:phytanoyl-CoA hydroxylase